MVAGTVGAVPTINGYVALRWTEGMIEPPGVSNGYYVYEHREVAARVLGRPLAGDETVHHEDEDRSNNDPANLFVFRTQPDHLRFHAFRERIDMGDGTWVAPPPPTPTCADCGSPTTRYGERCNPCAGIARRRVDRPAAADLHALVWAMPTVEVAALFGVSDVAVAKWCKAYGIDKPPRGYWAKMVR